MVVVVVVVVDMKVVRVTAAVVVVVVMTTMITAAAFIVNTEKRYGHINAVSATRTYVLLINFPFLVCLTTGHRPLLKQVPQTVRSSAPSFNLQYPQVSLTL